MGDFGAGDIIQPELICWYRIQIIWLVRRFIIISQCALAVKLKVANEIAGAGVIACWLYC